MEIILLTVGKTSIKYVEEGLDDFQKRLRHYIPFRIESVANLRNTRSMSETMQKDGEGKLLLERLQPSDFVVLLDERGDEMTSVEFSRRLQKRMAASHKRIVFIVGGPYGFSPEVYARASSKMSLSRLTLPHDLIRLVFTEQLYRAFTILRGEPYHHE